MSLVNFEHSPSPVRRWSAHLCHHFSSIAEVYVPLFKIKRKLIEEVKVYMNDAKRFERFSFYYKNLAFGQDYVDLFHSLVPCLFH